MVEDEQDLPTGVGGPATRALVGAGYASLDQQAGVPRGYPAFGTSGQLRCRQIRSNGGTNTAIPYRTCPNERGPSAASKA